MRRKPIVPSRRGERSVVRSFCRSFTQSCSCRGIVCRIVSTNLREAFPNFGDEEFWLFQRGEMAALRQLFPMDELWIDDFRPGARSAVYFFGEDACANRNIDLAAGEAGGVVFPVEGRRRCGGIRQPAEARIIHDFVAASDLLHLSRL